MRLVYPSEKYLDSYEEARKEYVKHKVDTYFFDDRKEVDIVKKYYNNRNGINLKEGYVPATTYWLVDKGEFIGEISIRHRLNDQLLKRGGHIGYGVRYSKWGQGFGTKMLAMALKKAKRMGLNKVLVTCNEDNIGSARVIEKNGGVFENVIKVEHDGKLTPTKRYWIEL